MYFFQACSSSKSASNAHEKPKIALTFTPDPAFDIADYVDPTKYMKRDQKELESLLSITYDSVFTPPQPAMSYAKLQRKINYPDHIKNQNISGKVVLRVFVDTTGSVTQMRVVESPHHDLSVSAANVVGETAFEPATLRGHAVASSVYLPFLFMLSQ